MRDTHRKGGSGEEMTVHEAKDKETRDLEEGGREHEKDKMISEE